MEINEVHMGISYNKLWKLLIDKKMSKSDLRRATGLAPNTITKLNKEEEVTLRVLFRICMVLNAEIGDIVEFVQEQTSEGDLPDAMDCIRRSH